MTDIRPKPKGTPFKVDFTGWGFGADVDRLAEDLLEALAQAIAEGIGFSMGLWLSEYEDDHHRGAITVEAYISDPVDMSTYANKRMSITELVGDFLDQYEDEAERRPELTRLADELGAMETRIRTLLAGPPEFAGGRAVR